MTPYDWFALGAVVVATFKTSEPGNMKLFLSAYFANPAVDAAWESQQANITEMMAADPFGGKSIGAGELRIVRNVRDRSRVP